MMTSDINILDTNLYLIRVTPGSRDPTAAFAFLALLETTKSLVGIFELFSWFALYHINVLTTV